METYSNNHLLISFQFCLLYSGWKILFLAHFAVTFRLIYISLVSYFERFLYFSFFF